MEQYEPPFYITHPLDVANFYEIKALVARSYNALGGRKKAVQLIIELNQTIQDFPDSTFKRSIQQHFEELIY